MKKGIMALIGMIVALVFIIVALVGPWYGMSISYSTPIDMKTDVDMSLTSSTTTMTGSGTTTISNADARKAAEAAGQDTSAFDILNNALYLTIISLVVAIIALIFVLGYVFNFVKMKMTKNIAMGFGIITFVMTLVAALYFMIVLPAKMSSYGTNIGFWYSTTANGMTINLGPGFAWYLMLVAGIIALISFIFVLMDKRAVPVYQNPAP